MNVIVKIVLALLVVVAPLCLEVAAEVVRTQDIAFGAIVAGPSGGSVTVTPAGSRSCSPGLACLPQSVAHPGRFSVSGSPYMNFVVTLPVSAALSSGGGNSMVVDNFDTSLPGDSGTLNSVGQAGFTVGATLHLEPGQVPAAYSGTFTIMVAYQ